MNAPSGEQLPETVLPLRRIVLALWMVLFVGSSQFLIVAPILSRIGEELEIAPSLLGTLVSGYGIAVAVFALLAGPISDRFGRRFILRAGTLWMSIALLLHGLADGYWSLIALRVIAGSASGFMAGAAVAYIGDVLPYHRRGWALGWAMSGFAFGQIVGIPMGTLLADWGGFRAPFVTFGVVMLLAFAGTLHVLVPTPSQHHGKFTIASGFATYAEILRRRDLLAVSFGSTAMMLSVSSYVVYQPTWLEQVFGATPEQIASLFLVGGIANAATGPIAGRLSDRFGRKILVILSSGGLGITMAVTPFLPSLASIYVLFFVNMALVGGRISPLNAWMTALVGSEHRGSLMSLTMATGQLGFAVGAALSGVLYTTYGYLSNAWLAALGAVITAVVLGFWVSEPEAQAA